MGKGTCLQQERNSLAYRHKHPTRSDLQNHLQLLVLSILPGFPCAKVRRKGWGSLAEDLTEFIHLCEGHKTYLLGLGGGKREGGSEARTFIPSLIGSLLPGT